MSHPQQQPSGKKKVEWSANLSSSEQRPTENNSPEWDSEADHNMLSYFLDNNGVTTPPRPPVRFPPTSDNPSVVSDRILQHPFRTDNFQAGSPGRSMNMRQDQLLGSSNADNDLRQPPPTPVIQHYFPSSYKTKVSSSSSSTIPSGTQLPQPTHQFPFTQHTIHPSQPIQHHPSQIQQQHQQQQIQQPPQIDPIQAMKRNFMGAYQQHFIGARNTTNTHYAFEGFNATMEEAVESISPALEFGGDHEPLLLPGKGGVATRPPKPPSAEFSSQVQALAGTLHETTYGISSGNPAAAAAASNAQQPTILNKGQASAQAPQIPAHLQFAQPLADAAVPTQAFPQPVLGQPAIAIPSAALVGGNHPFFFPHHLTAAYLMQKAETAEETEEKRAKRLERNRESARKSRRRKKERLSNLEEKVNKLYAKIEKERRVQINSMDTAWKVFAMEEVLELKRLLESSINNGDDDEKEKLRKGLLRLLISDIEQSTRKEIVEFQYNTLSQHLMPRYQKFFLWTILQEPAYFMSGKEEHAKREFSKKITTGKISSKQLGEEISNGKSGRKKKSEEPVHCGIGESERFWPLVCFELSISVEQEERFLETQGRSRQTQSLDRKVSQIVAATRLASNAKECILYQIYLAAFRKRKTNNDILNPRQAILFQEWLLSNKDRVRNRMSKRRSRSSLALPMKRGGRSSPGSVGEGDEDLTLEELCRCLEESLKISKNLPG